MSGAWSDQDQLPPTSSVIGAPPSSTYVIHIASLLFLYKKKTKPGFVLDQADLSKPESIPATLVGVHTVIDCATGRPEEPIKTVSFTVLFVCSKTKI